MHAYDADKVAGHTLIVRRAEDGEKLVTLDGKERELTSAMITIGDAEKAAGLGGVMGGLLTEVTDETKNVILELLPSMVLLSAAPPVRWACAAKLAAVLSAVWTPSATMTH